ncbi:FACT complex subunit spt16 [Bonamia ostreae]|uniref:FACT complex subunit n=1 Tax=Bonamia ostreae TaxID=126728 RepID=A0ABV2AGG6_9EUKA
MKKISYEDNSLFPPVSNYFKIQTDSVSDSILLPISGALYPIHVDFVKNMQLSRDDNTNLLQISLDSKTPENNFGEIFVKEIILRSKSNKNFELVVKRTKEIKKKLLRKKVTETGKQLNSNEALILTKNQEKVPKINNLKIRPSLGGKRSSIGFIEAHKNGFLFSLNSAKSKPSRIEILYKNVKHAFFQPAANTASVLLHLHLEEPLLLSRKTKDIQFYIDVVESSQNIEKNMKGDQEAIREEQRERFYKKKLNKIFAHFAKSVTKICSNVESGVEKLTFDVPCEELKFIGVPDRSTVNIYPTANCLVSIEEYPPFVLPLSDVEIAHFERVQFQIKHFDVVFIMKDLKSYKRIDAIPIKHLSQIRRFLRDANIIYFTGSINLDWEKILKEINSDLKEFWEKGGWRFLDDAENADKSSSGEESALEGESFNPSDENYSKESYSDEESDDIEESEED